ncbi:CHAT domain-containing protein [Algoriphagus vanfongensis]|uniref:CHAT domain-containing protein n=1 Tax=Algoriphagus vanfongensis TaxID=426371 RepID=UPI000408FF71|nr:CHAT domain-containing protein [Algoriphagus vanfongensis]
MFSTLRISLYIFCLTLLAPPDGFSRQQQTEDSFQDKLLEAASLLSVQNYLQAAEIFQQIKDELSSSHPDHLLYKSKSHFASGLHYTSQKNYQEAVLEFDQALEEGQKLVDAGQADYVKDLSIETYHNIANTGDWTNSLKTAKNWYEVLEAHLKPLDQADYVYDIAFLHDKNNEYHEAIRVYKQAISLYEALPESDLNLSSLALAYNNLGTMYAETGFFTQRKECYLKAKALWESDPEVDKSNLISIYGNLMRLYRTYGDKAGAKELTLAINSKFDQWVSEDSFGKSAFIVDQKPALMYQVDRHRINILYYDLTDDAPSALAHLDSLRNDYRKLSRKHQIQYSDYLISSILNTAAILDDYEDSKETQEKIRLLDLAMKESIDKDNYYFEMLSNADYCKFWLFSSNDLHQALSYLNNALQIGKNHDIREVNLLNLSLKKADILQQMGDFSQAEQLVKRAFSLLLSEEVENLMQIQEDDFTERNSVYYINAVKEAANVYRNQYGQSGKKDLGQISYHLYDLAAIIFQKYYQKGAYNPSLNMTSGIIHEGLMSLHLQLNKPLVDSLLIRVENNTSQLLWREFEAKHHQFLAVPDSLLLMHNHLRSSLAMLAQEDSSSDLEEIQKIQAELEENEAKISTYDSSYFGFFDGNIDIETIQNQLSGERAIIRYIVTDTKIFAFVVNARKIQLRDLGDKKPIFELLDNYHRQIQRIQPKVALLSRQLYQLLITPLKLEDQNLRNLVIIPDSKLNFLSFESLERPDQTGFLVQNYTISYSNSFKLWTLQQFTGYGGKSTGTVAAFVPEYPKSYLSTLETQAVTRSRLTYLEGALDEANYIVDRFGGELFHREKANKNSLLEAIGTFQIYHFATHAVMDKDNHENSGIYFQDGERMSYSELYQLRFPAELVVLSACNTGIGTLQPGEGMLSLSRALTYAGVKSAVYSLWQVPDEETAILMRLFYDFLDEGNSKETALAKAKKKFLEENPMKQHPYYWAGFVLNGNTKELSAKGKWTYFIQYGLYVIPVLLILLGALLLYQKRKST